VAKKNAQKRRPKMYYGIQNPTELYRERHELLIREAINARHARRLRAAPRTGAPDTGSVRRRLAGFLRRSLALWGRTGVPFFRA
jgi:hypothetical protein